MMWIAYALLWFMVAPLFVSMESKGGSDADETGKD